MEITVHYDTKTTKAEANSKNVTLELLSIYEGNNASVILENTNNGSFIQTDASQYLEYQADRIHYSANPVSLGAAIELFLSFLVEDKKWISAVDWKIDAKLTEQIQSLTDVEYQALVEDDELGSDFETDADGTRHWVNSFNDVSPVDLNDWREKILVCRRRIDSKAQIYRWEWNSVLQPIWNSRALIGERDAYGMLPAGVKQEFDKIAPVAEAVAAQMEALFWVRHLRVLNEATIGNISSMRRIIREMLEIKEFITKNHHTFPELEVSLEQVKERFAWCRAKKKIDSAEIASALSQQRKAEKLLTEAKVMLRQDWQEVFSGEEVPNGELMKITVSVVANSF